MKLFSVLNPCLLSVAALGTGLTAAEPAEQNDWFPFQPQNTTEPGAIGMQDWLPTPAGSQGRPRIDGKDLVYPDGSRAVFWGTNVEYAACAPEADVAVQKAAWFAKYGVNAVRLHKLTNPGWEGLGSETSAAAYDPEKLARFDRFMAELKANGIVYGFSPLWNLKLFPGDRERLVAYDELVAGKGKKTDTFGALWFADDLQQLHVDALVNLLDHRNPHTDLRYAEDPALLYVEIQNEDDIFFYRTVVALGRLPTYRGIAAEKFTTWLREKYDSEAALMEAWGGADAISMYRGEAKQEQSFADNSIVPVLNPWMIENHLQETARRPRLLDTMRFCYEMQNTYYQKVRAALEEIGYDGPLVGSNWQAGTGAAHYANLLSDRQIGLIDRHNYMGGSARVFVNKDADVKMVTMLDQPGSMLLSTGAQQMADRPFMLSEWLSIQPTPWTAADTTIIAAYGMGLQGWDVSFHFASNDEHGFTPGFYEGGRRKQFNNMVPMGFGLYPALARMVLRGDVHEGEPFAVRAISEDQVFADELPFADEVVQQHDIKSFGGEVPPAALAVGKAVVRVEDEPASFTAPDLDAHRDGDALVSTTNQLRWHTPPEGRGWISIDSDGTQGFAGFLPESGVQLADCRISIDQPYAVVLLSATDPEATIADDNRLLVTVQALTRQSGQRIVDGKLVSVGEPPILMQTVTVNLTLKREGTPTVYVCDHDGLRSERTVPITNGRVQLDTGRDRALYYEIVY